MLSVQIEAVVRRIKHLTAGPPPAARVLVFSSWSVVLDILAHALRDNGVKYMYAKDAAKLQKAITALRAVPQEARPDEGSASGPPPPQLQTILLPVKLGSNGLNLTEATHVVFVEPLVDPGVEAQAVGRIHRIGQTKPTFVHSFIVANSIEENVFKLNRERAASQGNASKPSKGEEQLTTRDIALLLKKPWSSAKPEEQD